MKSIGQMIRQIDGLKDTTQVNDWENKFIHDIVEKTNEGNRTTGLSEKQVECIERIYGRHFA